MFGRKVSLALTERSVEVETQGREGGRPKWKLEADRSDLRPCPLCSDPKGSATTPELPARVDRDSAEETPAVPVLPGQSRAPSSVPRPSDIAPQRAHSSVCVSCLQGYHDISSVFLLTLLPISSLLPPPTPQHSRSRSQSRESPIPQPAAEATETTTDEDAQRAELCARCLERLSLFRIRDGMGEGLEPVMGLLRLMKRLLRVADPELARMVNQSVPCLSPAS